MNFLLFQAGWFASVLGGAHHLPWVGPLVVAAVIAWHLRAAERAGGEALLIIACGLLGLLFDSALVALDWVRYPSGMFSSFLAPYWIVAMWMLFATTLNVSLRWLRGRRWLAGSLGMVAGPLTYVAGGKLGGVTFVERPAALVALAIGWAIMMPVLSALAMRLDAAKPPAQSLAETVP